MADIYKGELQDNLGNTVYPHTESDVVFCTDGKTVQEKLTGYENALGSVTGTSGSLEVGDVNILATTEATKKLNERFGGLDIRFNSETGKPEWRERGADSFVPFKSGDFRLIASHDGDTLTFPEDCDKAVVIGVHAFRKNDAAYEDSITSINISNVTSVTELYSKSGLPGMKVYLVEGATTKSVCKMVTGCYYSKTILIFAL